MFKKILISIILCLFLVSCGASVRYQVVKPRIPELKKYGKVHIPRTEWKKINYNGTSLYCTSEEEFKNFMNAFIELKKAKKFYEFEVEKYNEFRNEFLKEEGNK